MKTNTAFLTGLILFMVGCLVSITFGLTGIPIAIIFFIPAFIFLLIAFRRRTEFSFAKKVWLWFFFLMSIFMILMFILGLVLEVTTPPRQHGSAMKCEDVGGVCMKSCSDDYPIHNSIFDRSCDINICCMYLGDSR